MPTNIKQWLNQATEQLHQRFGEQQPGYNPRLDARLLMCHVLDVTMTHILSWPEKELSHDKISQLNEYLKRHLAGEPIAYILGSAEFWGLSFSVNPDVLVPRADTELLVESTLAIVNEDNHSTLRILDMGTGSGAIAIALASELTTASITALDKSESALSVAIKNAQDIGVDNVTFIQSAWFEQIENEAAFNIIVTNPPYVAPGDPHLESLTHEPDLALTSDNSGYADIHHIITHARSYIVPGGWLLIEHGYEQAEKIRVYFQQNGYQDIQTCQDLAGNDRMTMARYISNG